MRGVSILSLLLFLFAPAYGQTDTPRPPDAWRYPVKEKYIGLLVGASTGIYTFAEVGISSVYKSGTIESVSTARAASCEVRIKGGKLIIGPKASASVTWGTFLLGASAIYYTDLSQGTLALRPELGVGNGDIKMAFGYNWQIINNSFGGINTIFFGATVCPRILWHKADK